MPPLAPCPSRSGSASIRALLSRTRPDQNPHGTAPVGPDGGEGDLLLLKAAFLGLAMSKVPAGFLLGLGSLGCSNADGRQF